MSVDCKVSDYIAHVEINRPSKLNAFNNALTNDFRRAFNKVADDSNVRVVILSGAGDRAFTSGLDTKDIGFFNRNGEPARKAVAIRKHILEFQDAITAIERCEKRESSNTNDPDFVAVICVMHGIAYGLACDIACAADIRICAVDTRFAVKEIDIGLAADIGTLQRLPKIVGNESWVKELAYTAREFNAEEALHQGFISYVFKTKSEAIHRAFKIASLIVQKSPIAVQSTKHLLNYSRARTVEEGLRYTATFNSAALQTQDIPEAITAGMQRRKAEFAKL